jgi:hypothetical protein
VHHFIEDGVPIYHPVSHVVDRLLLRMRWGRLWVITKVPQGVPDSDHLRIVYGKVFPVADIATVDCSSSDDSTSIQPKNSHWAVAW